MTPFEIASVLWQTNQEEAVEIANLIIMMKDSNELTTQINELNQEIEDMRFELEKEGISYEY
jgi:hypothetical protein